MKRIYLIPITIFSVISLIAMAKRPAAVTYTDCSTVVDSKTGGCKSNPSCALNKTCHTTNSGCSCVDGSATPTSTPVQDATPLPIS